MQIISSLLFGISASLDALLVGMSFGIRGARITLWQNVLISIITLLGTCLSVGLGNQLSLFGSPALWQRLGSVFVILFGIYYIVISMKETLKKDQQSNAPTAQVFILGIALSMNNMGIGLSASFAGLTVVPAAIATLIFSFLFLLCGNHLGTRRALPLTEKNTNIISGLLLIGLGILELMYSI